MTQPHAPPDADWVITSFSREAASGTVREARSGREASFAFEAWVPGPPELARRLDDSERLRPLLFPVVGEPVQVEWGLSRAGREIPTRVTRTRAIELDPELTFLDWLAQVARHVPALAGWSRAEWDALFALEELDETVDATTPASSEAHLGLLAWLRTHVEHEIVARRLGWIVAEDTPGAAPLAAYGETGVVHVALDPSALRWLLDERLVALVAA